MRACVGDQNAVPFAAGPPEAGTLYANAGTGAFVLAPFMAGDAPEGLLASLLPGDGAAVEGTVNGAGSAIEWYERVFWHSRPGIPQPAEKPTGCYATTKRGLVASPPTHRCRACLRRGQLTSPVATLT
jgi:hypothetical protein